MQFVMTALTCWRAVQCPYKFKTVFYIIFYVIITKTDVTENNQEY